MKKRIAILIGVFLLSSLVSTVSYASESGTEEGRQNIKSMEEIMSLEEELIGQFDYGEMDEALKDLFPEERTGFKEMLKKVLTGEQGYSLKLIKQLLGDQLLYAFTSCRKNLIRILMITILASVFRNFAQVFQNKQVSDISFYVIYLLLIALCLNSFQIVMEWVGDGITRLTEFMTAFYPVYFLAVSVAKGSVTAVAFYNLVLFIIYLVEVLIVYFLLPVIHIFMMIKLLDFLSDREYLSKFAELIEVVVSWLLKTLLACVVGFNVIQGMLSPAIDTVKRSALTRGAEAIPGVGDAIGGVTEVVLGTAVLVKNGIGIVGMVLCLALCIAPIAQVGAIALMYKLAAAVIQPISDKRVAGCVECVGDGCRLLLNVVFTTGILFLLTIVIVSFVTGNV